MNLFNEFLDKFGKLDKNCYTSMFNAKCIIKPSIMKSTLHVDVINKVLIFVKLKYLYLFYNHNNPWIISFNVKVLRVLAPPIKNKQIHIS